MSNGLKGLLVFWGVIAFIAVLASLLIYVPILRPWITGTSLLLLAALISGAVYILSE